MTATYRNNLATKQGMTFEEIAVEAVSVGTTSLTMSMNDCGIYKNGLLGFGVQYTVLLTALHGHDMSVTQWLVTGSDDAGQTFKELKRFQRAFKKTTGHSLRKLGTDSITGADVWSSYIQEGSV